MKFRVVHPTYKTSYFPTLGEAIMYRLSVGGNIQCLTGGKWISCH